MTVLPVVPRSRANQDIKAALAHYLAHGGDEVARGFIDALEATVALIRDHPHIGSPRYAHALDIPGLSHRKLPRYPWLVLYIVKSERIEIVRVLDARRDIPATLLADDGP